MGQAYLEGEPPEIEGWFEQTRENLYEQWATTTGHKLNRSYGTWACEIAHRCRTCNEHLSIPCSLLREGNEVSQFLSSSCYSEDPLVFLRLYLLVLWEFVSSLKSLSDLVGVKASKPPKEVRIWANNWAKHRLKLLVQHHPVTVVADMYGDAWSDFQKKLPNAHLIDACRNRRPVQVIDYIWFTRDGGSPMLDEANSEIQAIVAVPPLITFLDKTITYYRSVIDGFLAEPSMVRQFESAHVANGCY